MRTWRVQSIQIGILLLALFSPGPGPSAREPVPVSVSILPQKYFLEKIGGDRIRISVMVPPGVSPELYEPRPNQLLALSRGDMYFAMGVPFEKIWLQRFKRMNPTLRIFYTDRGIEKRPMERLEDLFADRGPLWMRSREEKRQVRKEFLDPHVWTSPPLVALIGRNILMALSETDREGRKLYERNYREFLKEVMALDRELRELFWDVGAQNRFLVFHPAWGYFADAYGLRQIPLEIEGKEPKPSQLRVMVKYARDLGFKAIFVSPQLSGTSPRLLAREIGAKVIPADPLAPDWTEGLRSLAKRLGPALR